MQKLKSERGITLILLVTTIIVLAMISVPITINSRNIKKIKNYSLFKQDIDNLRESIEASYRDSDNISDIGPKYTDSIDVLNGTQGDLAIKNSNDNNVYYIIDLNALNSKSSNKIETLNYGVGNSNISERTTDVYVINEKSRTIYYLRGITYNDVTYYRLQEDFSAVNEGVTPGTAVTEFNKAYTDKYGSRAMIPVGYSISEATEEQIVSKGLVIKDNSNNEFVWIPTKEFYKENGEKISLDFERNAYANQIFNGNDNTSKSVKIYNSGNNEKYFYEKMSDKEKQSILENGGFYIGRYESGSELERTESSSETVPQIKKNLHVYNWIKKENAIKLSNNFTNNEHVTSRLCSSYSWDTTLKFIEKAGNSAYLTNSSQGNYTANLVKTGTTTAVNNIFDLGGNVYEWTLENVSDGISSTIRGGAISTVSTTENSTSRKMTEDISAKNIGFRITLFLN